MQGTLGSVPYPVADLMPASRRQKDSSKILREKRRGKERRRPSPIESRGKN
jgi:hypothetical protein